MSRGSRCRDTSSSPTPCGGLLRYVRDPDSVDGMRRVCTVDAAHRIDSASAGNRAADHHPER